MVNSTEFAKRLQKILDNYGISATAFSEEIEVNRSTISHLLSGRNKPSLEFVLKVIQHYPEVELYWLLNGKGIFPSDPKIRSSYQKSAETHKSLQNTPSNQPIITSEEENKIRQNVNTKDSSIERIVFFYKNGSFKSYEN